MSKCRDLLVAASRQALGHSEEPEPFGHGTQDQFGQARFSQRVRLGMPVRAFANCTRAVAQVHASSGTRRPNCSQ
jgi:hypothetical protein